MIDLHTHVLPGVDDGAESLEEAIELCRIAAEDGCTGLVATPHRRRDEWPEVPRDELRARFERLREACGDSLRLWLGGEIRVDSDLLRELDGDAGELPTLGGSSTLLLELDPSGLGPDPVELVEELLARGWTPLIAHPELTPPLAHDLALLLELVAAGARLQVTAASLLGRLGHGPRDLVAALFDAGAAHVVASDAHRPHWRPTGLSAARDRVAARWGEERATEVTTTNPLRLLGAGRVERARGAALS